MLRAPGEQPHAIITGFITKDPSSPPHGPAPRCRRSPVCGNTRSSTGPAIATAFDALPRIRPCSPSDSRSVMPGLRKAWRRLLSDGVQQHDGVASPLPMAVFVWVSK